MDAVGDGVDRLAVGDRVWTFAAGFERPAGGTAQEYAAIQLARWAGADVAATVSTAEKAALTTAAGAHLVVDHTRSDVVAEVRRWSPEGVDLIVDVAPARNIPVDLAVLAKRGTISVYADSGGDTISFAALAGIAVNARLQFLLMYNVGFEAIEHAASDLELALSDGGFAVGADAGLPLHWFDLEHTALAHAAAEAGAVGKELVRRAPVAGSTVTKGAAATGLRVDHSAEDRAVCHAMRRITPKPPKSPNLRLPLACLAD